MHLALLLALAAAPSFASDDLPDPGTLVADGAIHRGEIRAWDAKEKKLTVWDGKKEHVLSTSDAVISGKLVVGKRVDVTFEGDQAEAILVLDN